MYILRTFIWPNQYLAAFKLRLELCFKLQFLMKLQIFIKCHVQNTLRNWFYISNFFFCVCLQVFSIVVFGCIVNEGYINLATEEEEHCIFNRNRSACTYGVSVGVLAFLTCTLYLAVDVHFPQISSVKDRKKTVISDIVVSGEQKIFWL